MSDTATADPVVETPAPGSLAALAEAGDFAAFNRAREAQLRGDDQPPPVTEPETKPADGVVTDTPAGTEPQTDEEKAAAADAAKASDAGKALADVKNRGEERKKSLREEIDHLRWLKGEEERRIAALREEAQQIQTRPAPVAQPEAKAFDPGPELKVEDFTAYEDYVRAEAGRAARIAAHEATEKAQRAFDARLQADRDKAQQTTADAQYAAAMEASKARFTAFKAKQPDYDDVMATASENPAFTMNADMKLHLEMSDVGPELAYDLAKLDPKEFRRIADLPLRPMLAALGRLEGTILSRQVAHPPGPPAARNPVNPATRPIQPVGTSATVTAIPLQELAVTDPKAFMRQRDLDERRRKTGKA